MPTINRACISYDYDPRWGNATHQYDERGRITENSVIGTYEYTRNGYQQQKLTTNESGETYLEKYPLPVIRYNAFKAPEQIYIKDKERITYLYNAFGNRAHSFYGNAEAEKEKRPMLKHYSHDGSVEIVCNKTDNSTKFVFYLGGDTYSAPAVYTSNNSEEGKLLFLHRDQLGSIVAITDLNGKLVEARHFDAWGKVLSITDGNGNKLENLLLDRGYTGHEHLTSVGLIHMNGRLYDPALHRFLMPDNYIQDPFNTQNFNRYGYCLNNPLVYVDQDGEWIFLVAAVIGAYIGGAQANGTYNPFKWNYSNANTWLGIVGGAVIGGVSAGVGSAVGGAIAGGTTIVSSMVGGVVGGAISGGGFAVLPGGNGKVLQGMGIGALSGAIGGAAGFAAGKGTNVLLQGVNITSPVVKGFIAGAIGGAAGGAIGGFTAGYITTGNLDAAWNSAGSGAIFGAGVGSVSGFAGGYRYAKKEGLNPWNGRLIPKEGETIVRHHTSPENMDLIKNQLKLNPSRESDYNFIGVDFDGAPKLDLGIDFGNSGKGAFIELALPVKSLTPTPIPYKQFHFRVRTGLEGLKISPEYRPQYYYNIKF